MEKITKEELLEKLGSKALSDDELENVSGGIYFDELTECENNCINKSYNSFEENLCIERECNHN